MEKSGVKKIDDLKLEKQVQAVRVEFVPERTRLSSGAYTRALVDSDELEWIELSPETEDQDPAGDGGDVIDPTA